ncbi:MAG: acyltransferase [Candidatus Obscuribacterales bacterium]|nr:acyltransferase [Candidatus Obscuribacterales bacterium]
MDIPAPETTVLSATASIASKETALLPAGDKSGISYLPFLDGLRAISILLVLGFHQLGPVSGFLGTQLNGWVGVDLFFIISGFLISSILLKEKDKKGCFSLKNFYMRRWLRICPVYYCFLTIMCAWMSLRGEHDYAAFAVAGLYLSNFDMASGWGLISAGTGLLITWSLAVEEQFYLFWPATLKAAGKKAFPVCIILIAAAYFWRIYLLNNGASWLRLSVGLDTKLDSIMLGVALAMLWRGELFKSKCQEFFAAGWKQTPLIAAVLVSCHYLGHPATETFPLFFWAFKLPLVLLLMTALLLSLLSNPASAAARFLSTRPMVFVGRLSYSLYLWHVIVSFPSTDGILQAICHHKRYLVELAKFAACIGISAGSYYFIEQPFLKIKSKFS